MAFTVSALTLFSGFGLGTLLMPAFAIFFPVEVAVAATALVHAANNLFKLALLYREADRRVVLRFGLPAVASAFLGAVALGALAERPPLATWQLLGRPAIVTPIKLTVGVLILAFSMLELVPGARSLRARPRWLPLGGALSGFFGGLSGHQGALRAAFLGTLGLSPAAFAATQAVIACLVDAARLLVYGAGILGGPTGGFRRSGEWELVAAASLCAFAGALLGKRLLPRVTLEGVRSITGALLLIVGVGLGTGIL